MTAGFSGPTARKIASLTGISLSVTEFLQRARECAALADKMLGEDKVKLMEIAEAWLKLAEDAAKIALDGKPLASGDRGSE